MRRKRRAVIALALFLAPWMAGCWNKVEIEEGAYVLALGVDKGQISPYRVTVTIAKPDKIAGKEDGGGGDKEEPVLLTSVEAPSLTGALSMLNAYVGRYVTLSHVRAFLMHEELARADGMRLLDELLRFRQIRRTMFFIVTREPAARFLKELDPKLDKNPLRYIEQLSYQYKRNGLLPSASQIQTLASNVKATYVQPIAYYAALAEKEEGEKEGEGSQASQAESEVAAGRLPRTGGATVEMVGAAAFLNQRMVGVLTGEEVRYMLMIQDGFRAALASFKDPREPDRHVSVELVRQRPTTLTVDLSGNRPVIRGTVRLEAELVAVQSGIDYTEPELQPVLEEAIARQMKEPMQAMIRKTQEWKSDVVGFGRHAIARFPTVEAWEAYNWTEQFPKADIQVDVRVTLRRFGLTLSPVQNRK